MGLGQEAVIHDRGRGKHPFAPPVVPAEAYDEKYFLDVCAGSTEWSQSGGTESWGAYEGLVRLAGLRHDETLVDVGTGRGELLAAAVHAGASRAVGIEYSAVAVGLAQRTLQAQGAADLAEVLLCDARAIPLPSQGTDLVTFCDVVEHMTRDELAAALAEARRLLRPGGRVFIHTFPTKTIYDTTYRVLRLVLGRWRRWPRDPRGEYERAMHVNEQSLSSLRRALRRARFTDIDVRLGSVVYLDFLPGARVRAIYRWLATHRITRRLAIADLFATAYKTDGEA